jgi:hypothetical protein
MIYTAGDIIRTFQLNQKRSHPHQCLVNLRHTVLSKDADYYVNKYDEYIYTDTGFKKIKTYFGKKGIQPERGKPKQVSYHKSNVTNNGFMSDWKQKSVKREEVREKKISKGIKSPRNYFVYSLQNPLTKDIFYIGRTSNPRKRLWAHCLNNEYNNKSNPKLQSYIKKLVKNDNTPILKVLFETNDFQVAQDKEVEIIKGLVVPY